MLKQGCPIELSMMMKMFYICIILYMWLLST